MSDNNQFNPPFPPELGAIHVPMELPDPDVNLSKDESLTPTWAYTPVDSSTPALPEPEEAHRLIDMHLNQVPWAKIGRGVLKTLQFGLDTYAMGIKTGNWAIRNLPKTKRGWKTLGYTALGVGLVASYYLGQDSSERQPSCPGPEKQAVTVTNHHDNTLETLTEDVNHKKRAHYTTSTIERLNAQVVTPTDMIIARGRLCITLATEKTH
jgi:hypothetical protein